MEPECGEEGPIKSDMSHGHCGVEWDEGGEVRVYFVRAACPGIRVSEHKITMFCSSAVLGPSLYTCKNLLRISDS